MNHDLSETLNSLHDMKPFVISLCGVVQSQQSLASQARQPTDCEMGSSVKDQ